MLSHSKPTSGLFYYYLITIISIITFVSCTEESQNTLSISNSPIDIEWELNSNFEPNNQLSATITLINNGENELPPDGWALYFNSIRIPDLESFPNFFKVTHINGYFFKMEPTSQFEGLGAGESLSIPYRARYFAIKTSDAPEGFYFRFDDGTIANVNSVSIRPFEGQNRVNRSPGDNTPVATARHDFELNERLSKLSRDALSPITPTPVQYIPGLDMYQLPETLRVSVDMPFQDQSAFLAGLIEQQLNIPVDLPDSAPSNNHSPVDLQIRQPATQFFSGEAYRVEVSPSGIIITASGNAGAFYGVQSLLAHAEWGNDEANVIRSVTIEDQPAFSYRGMHLDVARNFQPKESVLQLLDIMALYKLNKFHFHLTDDEGWRIDIEQLPELTNVGGRRGHTETEENFMIPAYGSGPDPAPGASMGSGWFSRQDYIDILRYASDRHIEVIPEIDVPGHARAAILAMKTRANRLAADGDSAGAETYRLDEPADSSDYRSVQNYTDNVINVCRESTYRFMKLVIDELDAMHREAGSPLSKLHVGGDEVPHGAWEKSPHCRQTMDELGIENPRLLQDYFFDRVYDILEEKDIVMGGWEEVAFTDQDGVPAVKPATDDAIIPYVWSNIWGGGTEDRAYKLANAGYPVVMSHASNFYFDMAYNKHWQEPGFYWAAMLTTEEPFSFMPYNLFESAATTSYGNELADDYFEDKVRLNESARENILGLQGQLWTETVNVPGRMDYMIYPRLLGLAERAWTGEPDWSNARTDTIQERDRVSAWNAFANRLGQVELPRLDRRYPSLDYRIPAPGAVIRNNMLYANISFPGLTIRYELDGSEPTRESPIYSEPVEISPNDQPRISGFSSTGRAGRSVSPTR